MPQTYLKFCWFLSALCWAIILIRDLKVHPSFTVIKVLALGSVVETLLCYTEIPQIKIVPTLAPGRGPHQFMEGGIGLWQEPEVRSHKTGWMKSPTPFGEVERGEPCLPVWQLQPSPRSSSHTPRASHCCVFTWVMELLGEGSCKQSAEPRSSHSEGSWHPHQVEWRLPGTWGRGAVTCCSFHEHRHHQADVCRLEWVIAAFSLLDFLFVSLYPFGNARVAFWDGLSDRHCGEQIWEAGSLSPETTFETFD